MRYLLTILAVVWCMVGSARQYHIGAGGNNGNSGLSPAARWVDIAKANSFNGYISGDTIAFNCGETFYGALVLKISNITVTSYGTGAKPILTGLTTVTGWTQTSTNIWEATTPAVSNVNLVLRNNAIQQVARTPNAGLGGASYYYNTVVDTLSVTGPALSSTINWTGAEVVIRAARWELNREKIISHVGGKISWANKMKDPVPRNKYGYFIQRDRRCLDVDGEWFYDQTAGKLVVYSIANPNTYLYQISTVSNNITSVYTNVSITNLALTGANSYAIFQNGGSGISITNVDIYKQGENGIAVSSATNVTVSYNTLTDVLGTGIRVLNTPSYPTPITTVNFTANNNTLTRIAMIAGMESNSAFNGSSAMVINGGNGIIIKKNRVVDAGYCGIEWKGSNVIVENNYVSGAGAVRGDVGEIYTVENADNTKIYPRFNRLIKNNVMVNTRYIADGTPDYLVGVPEPSARGLYFDLGTRNVTADSNTVANIPIAGNAWHGNNNDTLTITNNVFYKAGPFSFQRFVNALPLRELNISNNVMYPIAYSIRELSINSPATTIDLAVTNIGAWDNNYYGLPSDLVALTTVTTNTDLSNYQERFSPFSKLLSLGKETSSILMPTGGVLFTNTADQDTTFRFIGYRMKDKSGANVDDSVTVPRWYSVVLAPNGNSPSPNQPPVVNAGADQTIIGNTTTLTGSASDPEGAMLTYVWSGPGAIASPTGLSTAITITGTAAFDYTLTATDPGGASASDTVRVTANPPVTITANAGPDFTTQLPFGSTYTLTGTTNGSTFLWSGPGTLSGTTTKTLTVTNATAGVNRYIFRVDGSIRDTAYVTVLAAVTTAPIATARDTVIRISTDTTTLYGAGRDGDGTIVGYSWVQVSGPSTATIATPTAATTALSGLVIGTYYFRLTVTDNDSLTGSILVRVDVFNAQNVLLKIQ